MTTARPQSIGGLAGHAAVGRHDNRQAYRRTAVLVGILFLTSTATFLVGDGLIAAYFSGDSPATSTLLTGVVLEAYTGLAVAGIGAAMLPVLRHYNGRLAGAYLALRALECLTIVTVGVYMLATLRELQEYDLFIYSFTAIGGIVLSYLLYVSRLVPRPLSMLGMFGYVVLLAGIPTALIGFADLDAGESFGNCLLDAVPGARGFGEVLV